MVDDEKLRGERDFPVESSTMSATNSFSWPELLEEEEVCDGPWSLRIHLSFTLLISAILGGRCDSFVARVANDACSSIHRFPCNSLCVKERQIDGEPRYLKSAPRRRNTPPPHVAGQETSPQKSQLHDSFNTPFPQSLQRTEVHVTPAEICSGSTEPST